MNQTDLDKKLVQACENDTPDFDEIKELITAGANTNQQKEHGNSIFEDVFVDALYNNRTGEQTTSIILKK